MTSHAPRRQSRGRASTKTSRKQRRAERRENLGTPRGQHDETEGGKEFVKTDRTPFRPMTPNQARYADSIRENILTFGVGPAGTGKSHCAVNVGAELLNAGEVERMIFTRPAVGSDEELGFFKGDLDEKLAPWVQPLKEILVRKLGASNVEYLIKKEKITFQPFATMRGHSWPNTFIMLDEAQNVSPNQMKLFLTRVGEGSTVVVDGDFVDQKDIDGMSGLEDALRRLKDMESVGHVEFGINDIVRSGFVKNVILAYRKFAPSH